MKTAKFNGSIYEVKETGRRMGKPERWGYDSYGDPILMPSNKRNQIGMYLNGKLVYTIGADGKSIYNNSRKHGEVFIKELFNHPIVKEK